MKFRMLREGLWSSSLKYEVFLGYTSELEQSATEGEHSGDHTTTSGEFIDLELDVHVFWLPRWVKMVMTGQKVIAVAFADLGFDVDIDPFFKPQRKLPSKQRKMMCTSSVCRHWWLVI